MLEWLAAALKQLLDWLAYAVSYLAGHAAALLFWMLAWFWDNLEHFLKKLFEYGAEAFSTTLALLEVPDFVLELQSSWDAVPWGEMGFYLEPFEIGYGLTVITGSAVLKFGLRIIPMFGVLFRSPS